MPDIELEYAIPSAEVSDFVTLFYRFRADIRCFEDTERADHAQLRFRLSGGIATYRMPDGSIQDAAPIHIIGPTTGAMKVSVEGRSEERRVGKEWVSTFRSRWSPCH